MYCIYKNCTVLLTTMLDKNELYTFNPNTLHLRTIKCHKYKFSFRYCTLYLLSV